MIVPEARYAMTVRSLPLTAGGLGGALSPPVGPGQGPGGGPGGEAPREALEILHFTAPKMDKKQVLFYLLQAYFFLKFWLSLKKRENTREKY